MIEFLKVIVLGIVEGITEWLPISSTGHLILVEQFLKLNATDKFKGMFDVVIQLGAILAVVVVYFSKLWPVKRENRKLHWDHDKLWLWLKIIVACIPAGVIGVIFDDLIDRYFYHNLYVVSVTLIVYGVAFILLEIRNQKRNFSINDVKAITFKTAFFIGLFQVLALIPGTSRSGATILGAMLIGTARKPAAEFTFFLAIPVMFGASLLKIVKFLHEGGGFASNELMYLIVGMVVAFAVSILAIKFLMSFIKQHDFKPFGIYRIILGVVFLVLTLSGVLI